MPSSYRCLVTRILAKMNTDSGQAKQYGRFVSRGIPDKGIRLIRQVLQRGQLNGNDRSLDEVEKFWVTG